MSGGSNEVKETEAEKSAAEVAMKQWNVYKDDLQQFEQVFSQRVQNLNTDGNMSDVKAGVDLQYNKGFSEARQGAGEQMTSAGINPNSGKFSENINSISADQAVTQGDTVNRAQVGEQDRYIAGLQDVTAQGMGQKSEAMSGLSNLAAVSNQKAIADAQNSFNKNAANVQLAGSLAGAGAAAYMNKTPEIGTKNFSQNQVSSADYTSSEPYYPNV